MKIAVGAAIFLAVVVFCYFAFSGSSDADASRIHELEQQVAELKAQLAESRNHVGRGPSVDSHPASQAPNAPADSTSDQNARMQELTELVQRFEQTARELNDRITRSKLNLPTRDELRVQMDKARTEVDRSRATTQRSLAAARQIAASLNVKLGEDSLLEPGVSSVLDANPAFVSARTAARADRKLQAGLEQRYVELRFNMAIDATPIKPSP